MSTSRDGADGPGDLDPTGVRSLLSSLPPPGPMPEDLVARISQRLAVEQERRESGELPEVADVAVPIGRGRRRPAQSLAWLAGAAAVAVATTVALSSLSDDPGSLLVSARYPAAGDSGQDDAGARGLMGAETDRGSAEGEAGSDAPTPVGAVTVLPGAGPRLTTDELSAQLQEWAAGVTLRAPDGEEAASASPQALGSVPAQECLDDVVGPRPPESAFVLGQASLDGREALVLLRISPEPHTAWVLGPQCGGGTAVVQHGPLPVP